MTYPDAHLQEEGLRLGDLFIPAQWIEASPRIRAERGFFHRVTLTVFVESLQIDAGVYFVGEGK